MVLLTLLKARFLSSQIRKLQQEKDKYIQVGDKTSILRCAENIDRHRDKLAVAQQLGVKVPQWCPFCGDQNDKYRAEY